jgi:endonuclease YncB( thermonuclease family)
MRLTAIILGPGSLALLSACSEPPPIDPLRADLLGQEGRIPHSFAEVIDGDTIEIDGEAINIRGVDAAELGPWAECWAEAALGGEARDFLVEQLNDGTDWRVQRLEQREGMNAVADIVGPGLEDIADRMVVHGHAASTDGAWDWCGDSVPLESPGYDARRPHGPNLWWPSNQVYDERAAM